MKRLLLHIGLEKTGTTSFQAFCAENRARLAERGVLYPANRACRLGVNHAPLAASYFGAADAERLLIAGRAADRANAIAALKAEMAQAETALVSAEHFSSRFDPGRIHALAADFAEFATSVALVVRHPAPRALSAYATTVASGRDITLDAFVEELCAPGNPYLRSRATIEAWASAFGRERMIVMPYREGADMAPALVERLIGHAPPEAAGYRRNASPPAVETERRRRANAAPWPGLARRLSRLFGDSPPGARPMLSPDQARRIETFVAEDLDWLVREYAVDLRESPKRS